MAEGGMSNWSANTRLSRYVPTILTTQIWKGQLSNGKKRNDFTYNVTVHGVNGSPDNLHSCYAETETPTELLMHLPGGPALEFERLHSRCHVWLS